MVKYDYRPDTESKPEKQQDGRGEFKDMPVKLSSHAEVRGIRQTGRSELFSDVSVKTELGVIIFCYLSKTIIGMHYLCKSTPRVKSTPRHLSDRWTP